MIKKNKLFILLIQQIILAVIFSYLLKNNNLSNCIGVIEKYLPYYIWNPQSCGSNSSYVAIYYFASFFPVLFLIYKGLSGFEKPAIKAKTLFVIVNFLSFASLSAWFLGAEMRRFPSLNVLHEGQLLGPTLALACSTIWTYLSIIFLIKEGRK
jgi:hypothetical protein